ncbi:MAG: right-handed parallel beta-helix repeat-containing protein [Deltaproteobacteria bacterium]|nr:right-handed parallel beta-helix repeat-containing protein [Deltaproteobacteria bacterium]
MKMRIAVAALVMLNPGCACQVLDLIRNPPTLPDGGAGLLEGPVFTGELLPEGGTVPLGGLELDAVPRAVEAATPIQATVLVGTDGVVIPNTAFEMGPDGLEFMGRVEMRIPYYDAMLPEGVAAEDLVMARRENGGWRALLDSRVDVETSRVHAVIAGFSTYALISSKVTYRRTLHVRAQPSGGDEFGSVPEALAAACEGAGADDRMEVVVHGGVTVDGTLTSACAVDLRTEDGATFGGVVFNVNRPTQLNGIVFTGPVTFNAADTLVLRSDTFQSTVNLVLTTPAATGGGQPLSLCPNAAHTTFQGSRVLGNLTLDYQADSDANVVVNGGQVAHVALQGGGTLCSHARVEFSEGLVENIEAAVRMKGGAQLNLVEVSGLQNVSSDLELLLPGRASLNMLRHEVAAGFSLTTRGTGDFALDQESVTFRSQYRWDSTGADVVARAYWTLRADIDGDADLQLGGNIDGAWALANLRGGVAFTAGATARNTRFEHADGTVEGFLKIRSTHDELAFMLTAGAAAQYNGQLDICATAAAKLQLTLVKYATLLEARIAGSNCGLPGPGPGPSPGPIPPPTLNSEGVRLVEVTLPPAQAGNTLFIENMVLPLLVENSTIHALPGAIGLIAQRSTEPFVMRACVVPDGAYLTDQVDVLIEDNPDLGSAGNVGLAILRTPKVIIRRNTLSGLGALGEGTNAFVADNDVHSQVASAGAGIIGVVRNNFMGATLDDGNPGCGLFINPSGNSGLDPENDIASICDYTGNGCADFPPSTDAMVDGSCLGSTGFPPPAAPAWAEGL